LPQKRSIYRKTGRSKCKYLLLIFCAAQVFTLCRKSGSKV
jgi:hypothetical protein